MLRGKVAIVTGASRGIGAGIALEFANEGANVVVTGRDKTSLMETAGKCRSKGVEVLELVLDLMNFDNLKTLIEKTSERFSRIDFLINNAGISKQIKIEEVPYDFFDNVFKLNVYAPFFLSKFAIPHLRKTKGCIVNVSSIFAVKPAPGFVPYSMSKAALDKLTTAFQTELSSDGIRLNSVNPGAVDTDMLRTLPDEVKKQVLKRQPFGFIDVSEVARAVLFLCSSSHATGNILRIDGGMGITY